MNWVCSFDDYISADYKGKMINKQGLGGFMVWEIDGDIPQTDPNYQTKSVVYGAWNGMVNNQ